MSKSWIAAIAAVLMAASARAETFQTSIDAAFAQKGAVMSAVLEQKELAKADYLRMSYEAQRGGHHRGGHARPPHHRPPSHRPPAHRPPTWRSPSHHHHHNWGRWHNHPGWGRHWYGRGRYWTWDPLGRPIWWGWVVWNPSMGSCRAYYAGQLNSCRSDCRVENVSCESACFGNSDCLTQCRLNASYCDTSCESTYYEKVRNYCL